MQAHGGQVSCESDKLNGTTFIINLPSSIVHSDASDANVGPMEYSFRIAIVDDDEIILAAWELAGAPGLVSTYRDPKEFLIDARAGALEEIDVVLLDLHFENASVQGLEVASKLNELYPNLPVLLTSILPVEHELTNIKGRIGKHPKHWHQILPNLVGAKF